MPLQTLRSWFGARKSAKGQRQLVKSTSIVAGMTMLSRVLGFVRDVVLAIIFGAGPEFDAFVIAFKLPNFMRRLFADGAFAQAFVPVLAQYKEQRSPEEVREFVARIAGTLAVTVTLVVAAAELLVPIIVMVFAPGFMSDPYRYLLASHMLHITFPYLLLISLVALAGATLNTHGRFAIPAFTPVLLNIALIGAAWFFAPHAKTPIYVLAWGVVAGGALQLALQIPFLKKVGVLPRPKWGFRDPGVRRVMKLMVPALFGVSVAQMSLLVDNFFASFLPEGSISWLYYSDRLTYLPLGVIGVALATVVMPYLSRQHSSNAQDKFSQTLDWALRCVVVIGVPSAVGLFILSGPLLATLIHHGAFDVHDVIMTRKSLMAFSLGLPGFMLVKVLASGFYSQRNIKTPVKIAAIAMGVNLVFNLILIVPLQHAGLALSTSISSLVNAGLLLFLLRRYNVYQPQGKWWPLLTKIAMANMVLAGVIFTLAGPLSHWLHWDVLQRAGHLAFVIAAGIIVYAFALWCVGLRLTDFKAPSVVQ